MRLIMKVTVLTNNIPFNARLESEHGLSLFVETDAGKKILFDTGQTEIFYRNAVKLGIDIAEAEYIVFSHGHYDHIGGFRSLHKILENKKLVFNSSGFFNKTKKEIWSFKFIGIKEDEKNRIKGFNNKIDIKEGDFSADDFMVRGNIPFASDREQVNRKFMIGKGNSSSQDYMNDEVVLCVIKPDGVIIITGCSHRGLINILHHIKQKLDSRIKAVIGGFHFIDKNQVYLEWIAGRLEKFDIETVMPLHCTGKKGINFLKNTFPGKIKQQTILVL